MYQLIKALGPTITHKWPLPKVCVLCQQRFHGSDAICSPCLALLPELGPTCSGCALPLPDLNFRLCGQCILHPPLTQNLIIPYPFIEPLRGLIHQFKFHQGLYLASTLTRLLLKHIPPDTPKPQVLIPVPIHPKKLKERGFNQAVVLAQHLSRVLDIPYDTQSCVKVEHTRSQTSTRGRDRQTNLMLTFGFKALPYEHVALIDDVYTTGSTLQSLARGLIAQGVKHVDGWCIARTI